MHNLVSSFLLSAIVMATLLISCEPPFEEEFELFVIKKGEHYSTYRAATLQSKELRFYARFDSSAIYVSKTPENQWDVNKLLGFSDANVHHQEHSARIGWRWLDNHLEVFAYVYSDSQRIIEPLGTANLGQNHLYEIILLDDRYRFRFDDTELDVTRTHVPSQKGTYYMLFPFFGGNEVAPHDIRIWIKMLY